MSASRRSLRADDSSRRRSASAALDKSDKSDKSDTEKNAAPAASKTPTNAGASSSGTSSSGIRTRLSTGTLFMNGTCTMRDPSQPRQSDGEEKETAAALSKKRQANEAAALPPPKRQKIGRNTGTGENNKNDYFCWVCHKDGPTACCEVCPRVFHMRCLSIQGDLPPNWVCPECEKIMRAECADTRSQAMSLINTDTLCQLLQFALQRMHHLNADPFSKPVDLTQNPFYLDHIFNPMDLTTLEKNIRKKMYGCTEAFLADAKWILHNCIIYNGVQDRLTSAAKTIIKICRHEMSEIEVCPDCYKSSCEQEETYWFCQPCRNPHPLVWAKLKGYPFWPAKALREVDGQVDVRFFGAHDRSWIPAASVLLLSHEVPNMIKKGRGGFKEALKELDIHIRRLRDQFGHFEYAPPRTPYSEKDRFKHVRPGSRSDQSSKVARVLKVEARTDDSSGGAASTSIALRRLEGDKVPMGMKTASASRTSAATKTATAVKSKYSHLPSPTKRQMALRQQTLDVKPPASSTASESAPDRTATGTEAAATSTGLKTITPAGVFTASQEMETQPLSVQSTQPSPAKLAVRRRYSPTDVVEKIHDKITRIAQSEEGEESLEPPAKVPRIKEEPLSGDEGGAQKKLTSETQGTQSQTSSGLSGAGVSKVASLAADASAKDVETAMDVADGDDSKTGSPPLPGGGPSASLAVAQELSGAGSGTTSGEGTTGAETATVTETSTEKSGLATGSGSVLVTESSDSAHVTQSSGASLNTGTDTAAVEKTGKETVAMAGAEETSGLVIAAVSSQSLDEVVAQDLLKQQTSTTQSGVHTLADAANTEKDLVQKPSAVVSELSTSQQNDGECVRDDAVSEPNAEKPIEGGSVDAAHSEASGKETQGQQETEPGTSSSNLQLSGQSYRSKLMQTIASCKAKLGMSSDEDVELSLEDPSEEEEEEEEAISQEEEEDNEAVTPAESEKTTTAEAELPQVAVEASTDLGQPQKTPSEGEEVQKEKTPDASSEDQGEAEKAATETGMTEVLGAAETDAVAAETGCAFAAETGSAEVCEDQPASAERSEEVPMDVDQESTALCRVEPGSVCSLALQTTETAESVEMASKVGLAGDAGSSIPIASSQPATDKPDGLEQTATESPTPVTPSEAPTPPGQQTPSVMEIIPVEGSDGAVLVVEGGRGGDTQTSPAGDAGTSCAEKMEEDKDKVGETDTSSGKRPHSATVIQKAISDKDVMAANCGDIAGEKSSSPTAKTPNSDSGKTSGEGSSEPARTSSVGEKSKDASSPTQDSKMEVSEEAEGDVVIVQEILAAPKRKVEEEERGKTTPGHSQSPAENAELLKVKMQWSNKLKKPGPTVPMTRSNPMPASTRVAGPSGGMSQSQGAMPCLGPKMDSRSPMGPRYPSMSLPTRSPDSSGQMVQDNRGRGGHILVSSTQPLPSCSAASMDSRARNSAMDSATILKSMADLAKQTGTGQQDRGRHVEHCLPQEYAAMFNGSSFICKYTTECSRSIERILADMYHEVMSKNLPLQVEHFNKEIQRLRQQHMQEIEELKHNYTLTMMEAKQCWSAELKKNVDALKQQHMQEIQEVKRKQWCAQCGIEAMYHCCWNTSYCSEDCQRLHWSTHCHTCEQVPGNQGVAIEASQTAADSSTDCGPDSTHTPTGNQPVLTWSEKDEAMAAKSTFNLLPPKCSQSGSSVSMVGNQAVFLGSGQQLQLQYLQPSQMRVPFQAAPMGPGAMMQGGPMLAPPGGPSSLMYPLLRPPSSQPLPPGGSAARGQVLFSMAPHGSGMAQPPVSMGPRPQAFPYRPGF